MRSRCCGAAAWPAAGAVKDLGPADLTAMMIGEPHAPAEPGTDGRAVAEIRLAVRDLRTAARWRPGRPGDRYA